MANATLVNFAAGETSPRSRGRFDLAWFQSSLEKCLNFIPEVSGPARYRTGFKKVAITRGGAVARMIPFQLNASQAYMLEFTTGYMRVYKDGALLTISRTTLTAATKANPCVITVASTTNLANGDEIIISDVVGMPELNGRQVKLANKSGSTYQLVDPVTGLGVNSTSFGAWTSGGSVVEVYEIASPYLTADLDNIQVAQTNTTMYIACAGYAPRKLTVVDDEFTLAAYSRTNDPFSITADPVEGLLDNFITGDLSEWTSVGTTEVGNQSWQGNTGAGATAYPNGYAFRSIVQGGGIGDTTLGYIRRSWTSAYGTWQCLVGSPLSAACEANPLDTNYMVWRFAMVDANNYYRFKIYGPNANSISIVRAIAGVEVVLATATITALRGSTAGRTFRITRTTDGIFKVFDNGALVLTVTDTTHTTATIMEMAVGSSGDDPQVGATADSADWDDVNFFGTNLYQTLCWVDNIYATDRVEIESPISVAFYEGRLGFFGTNQRPNTIFLSRAPDDEGNPRYDDFTGGTEADHACFFSLAPASGQVDYVAWARGTAKYLIVGTFGGPFRISGGGLDEPITPASINVRQFDLAGCEAVMPAGGNRVFYIQRGGVALRTLRFNVDVDDLETYDMLLNAEHIADSRLRRVVLQTGRPDIIWVVREDGILSGMTVQGSENVAGWHRQKIGGVASLVLDAQVLPRTDKNDQLWIVTERVVAGVTRHFIEVMADDVIFPDLADFYLGQGGVNRDNDLEAWKNAVYRRQEEYIHLDAAATYNGADRGSTALATLTPGAITGTGITFTASAAVFKSTDVGNELWKKPNRDTGVGSGRAIITAYVSSTQVTCTIDVDFDHANAIAAGQWHIATATIRGLWHLEGQVVAVVTDGAVYSDGSGDVDPDYPIVQVANGAITLTDVAAVVHVGLPYEGFIKTHNLTLGGQGGPVQNKPRNISQLFIRLLASLGVNYGTDIYDLAAIEHRDLGQDVADRPAPVFTGSRPVHNPDSSLYGENGKHVIISQNLPLPCVIQQLDIYYDTTEEA